MSWDHIAQIKDVVKKFGGAIDSWEPDDPEVSFKGILADNERIAWMVSGKSYCGKPVGNLKEHELGVTEMFKALDCESSIHTQGHVSVKFERDIEDGNYKDDRATGTYIETLRLFFGEGHKNENRVMILDCKVNIEFINQKENGGWRIQNIVAMPYRKPYYVDIKFE